MTLFWKCWLSPDWKRFLIACHLSIINSDNTPISDVGEQIWYLSFFLHATRRELGEERGGVLQIFFINLLSVALFLGWPHLCTQRLHAVLWKRPKYEIWLSWKLQPSQKMPQLGNKQYCSSFPRQLFTKAAAERKPAAASVNVSHLTSCSHTGCWSTTHCWTLNTLEIPPQPPWQLLTNG